MSFAAAIKAFEEKALAQANTSVSNAVESLFNEVVFLSPDPPGKGGYAKGVVKNSWYTSINGVDLTIGSTPNPTGAASLSRIKAALSSKPFLRKDGFITLTNSTPYINYVENIGWPKNYPGNSTGWAWTGKVGPYSMVKTSVTNFRGRYST